jgi:IS30 family transposase
VQAARDWPQDRLPGWRAENGGLPPAALPEKTRSNRFLSRLERQRIATLRRQNPDRPWHVCHETLYQALYQALYQGKGGLSRQLTRRLRTGRSLRKRRRRADARRARFLTPPV